MLNDREAERLLRYAIINKHYQVLPLELGRSCKEARRRVIEVEKDWRAEVADYSRRERARVLREQIKEATLEALADWMEEKR